MRNWMILVLSLCLAGCSTAFFSAPTATPAPTATATLAPTATATPTPTVTPTFAPTPTRSTKIGDACATKIHQPFPMEEYFSPGIKFYYEDNKIAYQAFNSDEAGIFDVGLPCCLYINSISPDMRWLTFENASPARNHIVVTNGSLKDPIIIPFQAGWLTIGGWINDHQLMIIPRDYQEVPGKRILLDPFTREIQLLNPPVTDFYKDSFIGIPYWNDVSKSIIYDPTLTRGVYFKAGADPYREGAIVMFDLDTMETIWELPIPKVVDVNDMLTPPYWAGDGSYFIMGAPGENGADILLVSRDGEEQRFPLPKEYEFFYSAIWSSDGKMAAILAFQPDGFRLGIFDIDQGKYLDTCANFGHDPGWVAWLPDSPIIEGKNEFYDLSTNQVFASPYEEHNSAWILRPEE